MNNTLTLIQPRHNYAPNPLDEKLGHIYMPTSLLAAGTKLIDAGFEIEIFDENIEAYSLAANTIGINLLGAPYIPISVGYANRLKQKYDHNWLLLIGGQTVSGLSDIQITQLFGSNVINGNKSEFLVNLFGKKINPIENLSLIPAYSLLSDKYMQLYLTNELSFYLSQGCKYSCSFCSAKRSYYDPITKKKKKITEQYRDLDIAYQDLEYLILKAQSLNINSLNIYLSNLDLFQTPSKLYEFANKVIKLRKKHSNFSINLRALSNVRSFLNTHRTNPDVILKIREAGLYRVGFGVDGATPKIWKSNRKPQTKSECINAIAIAKNVYGIISESLMVFGYNKFEDEESLQASYDFTCFMYDKYGAIPRPHVAKDIVPGNDGWIDERNKSNVGEFIENPVLFQNLDFTSLPSHYTHPDKKLRDLVIKYFLKMCNLPSSLTQYVKPEMPNMTEKELKSIKEFNMKRYDI